MKPSSPRKKTQQTALTLRQIILLHHVNRHIHRRPSPLDLIPPLILHPIVHRHPESEKQPECGEREVRSAALDEARALGRGEEEGGEDGEALADGVEHAEGDGALGLGASVAALPGHYEGARE